MKIEPVSDELIANAFFATDTVLSKTEETRQSWIGTIKTSKALTVRYLARAAQADALRQVVRELQGRCSKNNWIVYELQSALSEIEKEVKC